MKDKTPNPLNRRLDDRLADLTDELMSGAKSEEALMTEDAELNSLLDTVQRLKAMTAADQPPPAMSSRIRQRVKGAWQDATAAKKKWAWLPKLNLPQPYLSLVSVAAVAMLLLAVFFANSPVGDLPATASQPLAWWFGLVGGLCALAIIWVIATNRKH